MKPDVSYAALDLVDKLRTDSHLVRRVWELRRIVQNADSIACQADRDRLAISWQYLPEAALV